MTVLAGGPGVLQALRRRGLRRVRRTRRPRAAGVHGATEAVSGLPGGLAGLALHRQGPEGRQRACAKDKSKMSKKALDSVVNLFKS